MKVIATSLQFGQLQARKSTGLIVLHHSASPDVNAAEIHTWHLARGWAGIGYHFVIRRNGQIERGRPLEMIGAHAGPGINGHSIGICLCGNFMQESPGVAQLHSLNELIAELNQLYAASHPAGLAIKLHREVAATECPGKMFPGEQLKSLSQLQEISEGSEDVDDWQERLMQEAQAAGLIQEQHQPDDPAPKWFVLAVALQLMEVIKNGGEKIER